MIYELRTYTAMPGKLPALNARFRDHTVKLFERHGLRCIGFWTYKHGGSSDQLVYLMAFEDQAARDAAWAAFQADTEWQQVRAASEVEGPLVAHITSDILLPTDYSPA
ncbi:MAG: NIPSNAP family protein [Dehalococcoidia bacterium]|nr:NIPSNAP family protein [Dehalococcoidia bacterium]HRC63066.1 NIPSNAP family protein [Dehalococcoidia bacterium]